MKIRIRSILLGVSVTLCVGLGICTGVVGQEEVGTHRSNRLHGIGPFPRDYDSGSMAIHALDSSLDAYGVEISYRRLMGLSRGGFKFVYDSAECYEPLRDLYPVDVLQSAAQALGFRRARWELNKPLEEVLAIIKAQIDRGHPVIAPFLKPDAYHGAVIITGYDLDENILYLQGAFEESAGVSVTIPEAWDGPTSSPLGWATNPIFVMGGRMVTEDREIDRSVLTDAIQLLRGGSLPYGEHSGEIRYMADQGPHDAAYGLPAYDLLSYDVEHEPLVREQTGESGVNFGFIWRLDSQIGQLEHDRHAGSYYLRHFSPWLPEEKRLMLTQVASNFEKAAEDARSLREIFWHEIPQDIDSVKKIREYLTRGGSMVFILPENPRLRQDLEGVGIEIFSTPWGWLLIDDSPGKRASAKILVKSIASRDRNSLGLIEEVIAFLDRLDKQAEQEGGPGASGRE